GLRRHLGPVGCHEKPVFRLEKMGQAAHWQEGPRPLPSLTHWAMRTAAVQARRGERLRGPAAPTPRAAGVLPFRLVTLTPMVEKVLLASPRGYCAGVERAVETVERALELYGTPVYVRKQIVHNLHVVRELEERGAIFVEDELEVPEGRTMVLSAH